MEDYLKVYPKHGFLNTEYKIRSEKEDSFTILFNGQEMFEGVVGAGETKVLPKLNAAGEYIVIGNQSKERHKICVENALRFGSSDLKRAYVFDDFPYLIFVMKDRIHFFDPSIETYVYTENYLCPNDIKHITDGKLLFSTEHSGGTSFSIFDTEKLRIEYSLEVDELIAHSNDYKTLYVLNKRKSSVCIVKTENLSVEAEFNNINLKGQDSYHVDNENGLLYIVESNYINVIVIDSNRIRRFDKTDNIIGITNTGFIISRNGTQYEYEDLKPNSVSKGSFKYSPLISDFSVDGLVVANADCVQRTNKIMRKISFDICVEFANECREKIENGIHSVSLEKEIEWDEMNLSAKIYPSNEGVYIIEEIQRCYNKLLTYNKQTERVSVSNSIDRRKRIVWISNEGYETYYSGGDDYSLCIDDIFVEHENILFKVKPSLYLFLRNGKIVSTFSDKNEAGEFFKPHKESYNSIIVDGIEISTSSILCKSNNKLVYKSDFLYSYCEMSESKSEWQGIKTINLEEEKYAKAKMSSNGKYLVYPKGGNKYALYNILEQKEETVLTGNFVDFDKTDNLLFMEYAKGERELKVYNPITFQWEKSNVQYYTFISPDGKLYAKTDKKSRYFNRLIKEEISRDEFLKIKDEYDTSFLNQYTEEQKAEIEGKRKSLVSEYAEYFESYSNENKRAKVWIDNIQNSTFPDFSAIFLQEKHYVVIGIVDAEQELDIELGTTLSFLNYVAFSYDNKYVGIVGKPGGNGYLKLIEINYNETKNTLSLEREICDTEIARYATWICAFTKNGLFGTYDSTPDLYLIKQADFEKFNNDNAHDFNFIREQFQIKGRSLLCFSPSGRLMALSNQGYEAKSLGGIGHVPSNDVYIYDTETREELSHWQDQGERIAFRNVVTAGFSIDESKLMTVSVDGVIVVRNIGKVVNNEEKSFPHYILAEAS
ncbi:MAG: hypothetical protein MJZ18_01695 [Bacteroidales bacterium]|nr:hypothetical protein [Bacteroidales bacterium]